MDPGAELHVWLADLDAGRWPAAAALPPGERERAARILRPRSGCRWAAARWALRGVLGHYLGSEPAAIELAIDANGKPRLSHREPALRFNLSHSHGLAAVAVAREREVGVDVEWIDPDRDLERLAARELEPGLVEQLRAAPTGSRPRLFYAAWARREAIGKCLGVGLGAVPDEHEVAVAPFEVPAGFAGAVAIEAAAPPPLRRFAIDYRLGTVPPSSVGVPRAGPDRR